MKFQELPRFPRYSTYTVDIGWDYLETWLNDIENVNLNPDFQRHLVWSEEKKISYVEYILKGGVGSRSVYFNCSTWDSDYSTPLELIDGKQRVHAVLDFLNNRLQVFGLYFKDIEGKMPLEARFRVTVNNLTEYKDVLQWYLDLNSGGVAHTDEEIVKVRNLLEKL